MTPQKTKILVVDDEYGMREGCRKVLGHEGYEVFTAPDGLKGLEEFTKHGDFSAALIDLKMPGMGGIELIEKIRSIDQDVVLLVITANTSIESAVEATKRGAFGYIPKPFTPNELVLPIKQGLEMRRLALNARRLRQEREARLLELTQERSKSSTIIGCLSDAVLVINLDDQIVLMNEAASMVNPLWLGKEAPFPIHTLGHPELEEILLETIHSGTGPRIFTREIVINIKTYMVNASPVIEPTGSVIGGVAVLRDISELKNIETAKSLFVSMVAHELKNPLAVVEGYLDLILCGDTDDDPDYARKILERSRLRVKTLRELIADIVTHSSIKTGRFSLSRIPIDLVELLRDCVREKEENALKKEIDLIVNRPDSSQMPSVLADVNAIRSIFKNLIDNAIKYTPASGKVSIEAAFEDGSIRVTVRDNGIGIDEQEREAIFEEFYRIRNAQTADIPGTGLGLSLAKNLVEMHHGRIVVDSAPGRGSAFTVILPVIRVPSQLPPA